MRQYYRALTIAGFDGSGGAGIQADLKAFSALGCYGMSVLTALPVQNTQGVKAIYEIPEKCVAEQLQSILEDIGTDVIKIGMLHRPEVIQAIVPILEKCTNVKMVLDPVMVAKNGHLLLSKQATHIMQHKLFPLISVLTPNLPEAESLLQREIKNKEQMEQAAIDLVSMGPKAVVVKGGHLSDVNGSDDCLCVGFPDVIIHWFSSPRIETKNTHGTGCTFSAAIAAHLARGCDIVSSVSHAKSYLTQCIEAGATFQTGQGNGPLHHFHAFW